MEVEKFSRNRYICSKSKALLNIYEILPCIMFKTYGKPRFYIGYAFSIVNRLIDTLTNYFFLLVISFWACHETFINFFFIVILNNLRYNSAFHETLINKYVFPIAIASSNLRCMSAVTRNINVECVYRSNEITKNLLKEITNNYEDEITHACA